MEHFTYLGSVISNDATVNKDLDNRLSKASSSFGRLSKRVWQSHSLRLSTKLQVHRAVVVPTLLYGAETWVLYRKQIRTLERFNRRCLRSIFAITIMARPRVERRSPQESHPAQHTLHFASGAATLGWPRHKNGRRTHAQSSLLQRPPRRKARLWYSKKALQRSAEEAACTGWNQPSVMASGGLRPTHLAYISEKSQL